MISHRLGDAELHFWLTRSVAKVMGISLTEAMSNGRLTAQDYASLVTTCRGCNRVGTCQCWLGEQLQTSPSAPPGCLNGTALATLAHSN